MLMSKRLALFLVVAFSPILMGAGSCVSPSEPSPQPHTQSPVALCAQINMFYCPAIGAPTNPILTAQGWNGYCSPGNNGGYQTGYSGYSSNAFTPVYRTSSEAWDMCNSRGPTDRGWCLGVITCSHQ